MEKLYCPACNNSLDHKNVSAGDKIWCEVFEEWAFVQERESHPLVDGDLATQRDIGSR